MTQKTDSIMYRNNLVFAGIIILVLMLAINQFLIPKAFASSINGGGSSVSSLGSLEYGSKKTLKPMPIANGEQPAISGYKSKIKSIPTISELPQQPSTGDVVKDLTNNLIPRGTPWYGEQAGVSFDDPVKALTSWGKATSIELSPEEQKRWQRIVNSFTCDFCCGSPQNPTIITRCGCAHSRAAQGITKWFVKYYGDQYTDEEIYGEAARWFAAWYPGPTIKRILQESK